MSPGVYIQFRDLGLSKKRITLPIQISPSLPTMMEEYYIYNTHFSNAFTEYPVASGSLGKVWISGSSYTHQDSFLFIKNDNTLWGVGANQDGQLGLGNKTETWEIQQISGDSWKQVSMGVLSAAGITTDGKLYTWGSNDNSQLGTGSLVESLTPTLIDDSGWKSVSVGNYQALGIKTDGTLWSWGKVTNGELGIITSSTVADSPAYYYETENSPTSLDVYVGTHTTRYRWESGYQIYLGRRLQADAYLSASIKEIAIFTRPLTDVQGKAFRQEMINRFPLAGEPPTQSLDPITPEYWWRADEGLTTSYWSGSNGGVHFELTNVDTANVNDGAVFNGVSSFGTSQILSQNIDAKHVFIRFDNLDVNDRGTFLGGTQGNIHEIYFQPGNNDKWFVIESLSGGGFYAAQTTYGFSAPQQVLWVDFTNYTNQYQVEGPLLLAEQPMQIGTGSNWEYVYAGDRVSFAINDTGEMYGWGRNTSYVIGQSDRFITYNTPVLIDVGPWRKVVSDGISVYAIKQDETLWGWGSNDSGLLTPGEYTDEGFSGAYDATDIIPGGAFIGQSNTSTRIVTAAGSCTTSSISNTLLGSASLTLSETPTSVSIGFPVNDEGNWELVLPFNIEYNGTTYNTIYVNANSFITFGTGYVGYLFDMDTPAVDKLYISGYDNYVYRIYYGQEGDTFRIRWEGNSQYDESGTTKIWEVVFYQNIPNQIDVHFGDNGNWIYQSAGGDQQFPIQIGSDTWKDVSMSVYGEVEYEAGGAVKSDGTLWMWGSNDLGQLGFGDTVDRPFPTQVGSDTDWRYILRGVTKNTALKG